MADQEKKAEVPETSPPVPQEVLPAGAPVETQPIGTAPVVAEAPQTPPPIAAEAPPKTAAEEPRGEKRPANFGIEQGVLKTVLGKSRRWNTIASDGQALFSSRR